MSTLDHNEIQKFAALSEQWWNREGAFKQLHLMNHARIPYITKWASKHYDGLPEEEALSDKRILDIGCGGGILSIPLSKLRAIVTGLDAAEESIKAAQHYAQNTQADVRYIAGTIEGLCSNPEQYDIICALEVLEHVSNVNLFLKSACAALKPEGLIFISTINRSFASYIQVILLAERVLKIVPKETHQWHKFLKPSTVAEILQTYNCKLMNVKGMKLNIIENKWYIDDNTNVNYIMVAKKQGESNPCSS